MQHRALKNGKGKKLTEVSEIEALDTEEEAGSYLEYRLRKLNQTVSRFPGEQFCF